MKKIKLGKKATVHKGYYALVDDEDYEELNQYSWQAHYSKKGGYYYAMRAIWNECGKRKNVLMHVQILKTPKGMHSDHINHNTLDNRRKNLRVVTPTQNHQNRCSDKKSTSKFKGVAWYSKGKKWAAKICVNKKIMHLGYFINEKLAAKAYDEMAILHFGEYSYLNLTEKQRAKLPPTPIVCTFTSEYRGVSRSNLSKKWKVSIMVGKKAIHLGYFIDEKEAARAYDQAARKYHGKRARLNFPEES